MFLCSEKPVFTLDAAFLPSGIGKEMVVKEGEKLVIPCPAIGTPTPAVTWSLDGRPIPIGTKDYSILVNDSNSFISFAA